MQVGTAAPPVFVSYRNKKCGEGKSTAGGQAPQVIRPCFLLKKSGTRSLHTNDPQNARTQHNNVFTRQAKLELMENKDKLATQRSQLLETKVEKISKEKKTTERSTGSCARACVCVLRFASLQTALIYWQILLFRTRVRALRVRKCRNFEASKEEPTVATVCLSQG